MNARTAFSEAIKREEIHWVFSDETKIKEVLEAENEMLRKKIVRLKKQLTDAKKVKKKLLEDNTKLGDSLLKMLPEEEDSAGGKTGEGHPHRLPYE